jgi:arylformamidase
LPDPVNVHALCNRSFGVRGCAKIRPQKNKDIRVAKIDKEWLDRMYNNRALVPEHPRHLAQWAETSARVRRRKGGVLDVAYGKGAMEKLDIFPAGPSTGPKAPVLVFIHGGWWRSLDKSDHVFVAPAFNREGACVVLPNYDLCPAVTIPQIALQMVQALAWVYRNIARYGGDPKRITVAGHSAGGHLAAMMLACQWRHVGGDLPARLVKNALSISGLHELESIRHTPFLAESLRLTRADAKKSSPAWMPRPRQGRLVSVAGGDESAEFLRQNALIQEAWGHATVPVAEALPGLNHFSIVEALTKPRHRLHQLAAQLLAE